jgi:hypothetical protein
MVLPGCNHPRRAGDGCRGGGNLHRGRGRNNDYPEMFAVHQLEVVDARRVDAVDRRVAEWRRNILRLVLSAISLAALMAVLRVGAQTTTTGDIAGVVTDPTAAVVSGALITLENIDTGSSTST